MSLALLAALVGVWLGSFEPPPAQPPGLALDWSAPQPCPQLDGLELRLRALLPELGPIAPGTEPAPLRVEGQLELASADAWQVTLRFVSERGVDERRFAGRDCAALTDAAALVVAIGIDPVAVSQTLAAPEPAPEPEAKPAAVAEPSPEPTPPSVTITEPVASEPPTTRPGAVRLALAALGGGGYGPLDLGVGQLAGELALFGPRWRAGVRGAWLIPRTRALDGAVAGEARYSGYGVAARGCGVPGAGPVELPICAGIEVGALRGRGVGATPDPRAGTIPWVAALVGPGLRWAPRPRVALAVDLELVVPLVRGGFRIADATTAELAPAGVQAFAGVELRLP